MVLEIRSVWCGMGRALVGRMFLSHSAILRNITQYYGMETSALLNRMVLLFFLILWKLYIDIEYQQDLDKFDIAKIS